MVRSVAAVSANSSPASSAESSFRELDDVFLQTQTRIWLGEVLQARLDEHLNISDLLADGELLFQVSKVIFNLLLENCMELQRHAHKYNPIISRKSSGRYKPYSNVDSFLKVCKILGLNGIDLFSPSDVVEKRDTRKVCICIRALSKKARSKQLNIPDFDKVTYMVTMPNSLVGCLRKSLEQSQCTLQTSNYSSHNGSRLKLKQKNSGTVCSKNYDSCSEESDEAESRYVGAESSSLSASNSDDTAFLLSDLESSAGTCFPSAKQFDVQLDSARSTELASFLSPHTIKNDPGRDTLGNFRMKNEYRRGAVTYQVDHGLENDVSVVGDSLDDDEAEMSYISNALAFSDLISLATDGNSPVLFGQEDVFNILMGSDCFGSNSKQRIFQNGIRGKYSDDMEDVEISSTDSMSSVLGRMLNLDFDDQFDEQDFQATEGSYTRLLDNEAERDESSVIDNRFEDIDTCEGSMHPFNPKADEPKRKLQNIGFSTECFSICPHNWQSYNIGHQNSELLNNKNEISQSDSGKILLLEGMDLVSSNSDETINKEKIDIRDTMFKSDTDKIEQANNHIQEDCCDTKNMPEDSNVLCSIVSVEGSEGYHDNLKNQDIITLDSHGHRMPKAALVDVENSIIDPNFLIFENQCGPASERDPCSTATGSENTDGKSCQPCGEHSVDLHGTECTNKDARKPDKDILVEEISEEKEDYNMGPPKEKSSQKSLLKTVAKGTAVAGALFLLLFIRKKTGRDKIFDAIKQPDQMTHKASGSKLASQKEQKGDKRNGIYPAANLKFGN